MAVDVECNVQLSEMRWKLAFFGEPQKCPSCNSPLEFSRSWLYGAIAIQLLLLLAVWVFSTHWLGLISLSLGALAVFGPLVGFWMFAPIKHQTAREIRNRNLFLLASAIILILFAVWLWITNSVL